MRNEHVDNTPAALARITWRGRNRPRRWPGVYRASPRRSGPMLLHPASTIAVIPATPARARL